MGKFVRKGDGDDDVVEREMLLLEFVLEVDKTCPVVGRRRPATHFISSELDSSAGRNQLNRKSTLTHKRHVALVHASISPLEHRQGLTHGERTIGIL